MENKNDIVNKKIDWTNVIKIIDIVIILSFIMILVLSLMFLMFNNALLFWIIYFLLIDATLIFNIIVMIKQFIKTKTFRNIFILGLNIVILIVYLHFFLIWLR